VTGWRDNGYVWVVGLDIATGDRVQRKVYLPPDPLD
jgi:hypothetical protein